jgi:IS5 family transposase
MAGNANDIPLGAIAVPANRRDSSLLELTLDTLAGLGPLPDTMTVHLDRGYDSRRTRERLVTRGRHGELAANGTPAPIAASRRWPVERTSAWTTAHTTLVWCTERRARVIAFWLAVSAVIIIVRRLVREGWTRYRCDDRPTRKP